MESVKLPPLDLEFELDEEDLARPGVPIPMYIVSKRLAQRWISEATRWDREDSIAILDLASGEGEFSDIVCDFADAREKVAVWVDREENQLLEGLKRTKTFRVETLIADLDQDDWSPRLAGRRFDRVTLGIAHHHLDDDRYREILTRAMREHLTPGGLALIVEVCSGLYAEVTREMVLPRLHGSIPPFAVPVAGTPKLIESTVRHPGSGRQWTVEYFSVALAMPDDGCRAK